MGPVIIHYHKKARSTFVVLNVFSSNQEKVLKKKRKINTKNESLVILYVFEEYNAFISWNLK